jgi:hypothetical protein
MELEKLTKQELINLISSKASLTSEFKVGIGSSIPSDFFIKLQEKYIPFNAKGMENIAALICNEFGVPWTHDCDSSLSPSGGGGTVTKKGLIQVLKAIEIAESSY